MQGRAKPFTEIFSVRTDIPPEVVCASFGDHCMEPCLPHGQGRVLRSDRKQGAEWQLNLSVRVRRYADEGSDVTAGIPP